MAIGRKRNGGGELLDIVLPAAAALISYMAVRPKAANAATPASDSVAQPAYQPPAASPPAASPPTRSQPPASPPPAQRAYQPASPEPSVAAVERAAIGGDTSVGLAKIVAIVKRENDSKIREIGGNTDRGPRIEQYQRFVGDYKHLHWCMAFVQFCIAEAMGLSTKVRWGNGSCSGVWQNVKKALDAGYLDPKYVVLADDPDRRTKVKPGYVWIMVGHTGIVVSAQGSSPDRYTTIEGNTWRADKGHGVLEMDRPWGHPKSGKNVAWFDPIAMQEAWVKMRAARS